ncbi:MAG: AbrB/MazE/SpoVT family DNA-binding domain-containing protein [Candidatus Aminicenantes bacterium]|nr:AbrB/MazE/SpoVT family DNA-binding domain-containing protein [Candidatus Aminicenantes bacterium]
MVTHIQKWGNSLAVRIPKAFADEIKLVENTSIQMMLKDGALMIFPEQQTEWSLEDLLADVTDQNTHGEWETGAASGKETW